MKTTKLHIRNFWVVSASVFLIAFTTSAHAQFGALFQSLIQMPAKQQQVEQERQNTQPVKIFAPTNPIPSELQSAARNFSEKTKQLQMRPLFERLYVEGERNATLNFQRIGLAALEIGDVDLAEKAFESAITRIDQIYADNPEAQNAKSLWTAEKVKDYKGEPYERVMAMFYRGLVYAVKGDFQNARAMFKQADYQDTVSESEQYAGDFALMPYMAGWASYCDGNSSLANDFLQMAVKGDSNYSKVSVDQPVLVLFETGRAPFKYGAGKFGEELRWESHKLPDQKAISTCINAESTGAACTESRFVPGADINFQATTRGGRFFDAVLGGKANFKEGAQGVANVAGTVGQIGLQTAMLTGNRDAANLGVFGMFAGLVAQGVAASTQAQADTREWEQLPGMIWLTTDNKISNAASVAVGLESLGEKSSANARRIINSPRCQLYWGRAISPLSPLMETGPIEPGAHKRDPAFRLELQAVYGG